MKHTYKKFFPKTALTFFCSIVLSCLLPAQAQYGWLQKAGFPGPARHRASAAAVGTRGYLGLGHINSVVDVLYQDWFEYDPGTDTWSQKANYPGGPRMHAATFVVDSKIYVGTGRDQSSTLHQDFWCYDPATNQWTAVAPFPGSPRRGAVAFALNGFGYVGTGSYTSDFYKYDPALNSWTNVASLPATGRISSVAFAINGKGYLGTGDGSGPMGDMWEYNPTANSWTQKAQLPGLPRMEATGFALNGKGYIGTGDNYSSGTNYQDFWCFDPVANSWMQVTDFAGAARRYMVCFTIGNRAYAGTGTSGINYADLWEYGSISGIEENAADASFMEVYPQPFTQSASIRFAVPVQDAEIILSDLTGKEIRRIENISGEKYDFEKEDLSPGIYFCTLVVDHEIKAGCKILLSN